MKWKFCKIGAKTHRTTPYFTQSKKTFKNHIGKLHNDLHEIGIFRYLIHSLNYTQHSFNYTQNSLNYTLSLTQLHPTFLKALRCKGFRGPKR